MKEIKLTKGFIAIVDDEDFEKVNKIKWCTTKGSSGYYAHNHDIGGMHRFIINCPKGMIVDHIDHNTLNNQKLNLRLCNHSENSSNKTPRKNGASKYLGVSVLKFKSKHVKSNTIYTYYIAGIIKNGKKVYQATFKNEIDAAIQYDIWAKEVHGEFANLNFK